MYEQMTVHFKVLKKTRKLIQRKLILDYTTKSTQGYQMEMAFFNKQITTIYTKILQLLFYQLLKISIKITN